MEATALVEWLVRAEANRREEFLIIGDFNRSPFEEPCSLPCAAGLLRLMDEADPSSVMPTRADGDRVIDYGICTPGIIARERAQKESVPDHHLVAYGIERDEMEVSYRRPKRPTLAPEQEGQEQECEEDTVEVDLETWNVVWLAFSDSYRVVKGSRDTWAMWEHLSESAEVLLAWKDNGSHRWGRLHTHCRSRIAAEAKAWNSNNKREKVQTIGEVRLQRFFRRVKEWHRAGCVGKGEDQFI